MIDFGFGIFCEFWSSVAVEYADGVSVDGFQLLVGILIFAGVVGFVLHG